jgi:hypothetical protein
MLPFSDLDVFLADLHSRLAANRRDITLEEEGVYVLVVVASLLRGLSSPIPYDPSLE